MSTPPRPTANISLITAAVKDIAQRLDIEAEDIADVFSRYMDGYQPARALESHHGYDFDLSDAEELDNCASEVDKALREEQRIWAELWNIQPPLPIGAHVTGKGIRGVIAGICDHYPASYKVKKDGCTDEGRYTICEFESVSLVNEVPA